MNLPQELEELQTLIAEAAIKFGVQRVITQEVLQERCQHYLQIAKQELEAIGPENDPDSSAYTPVATVFGQMGQEGNVKIGYHRGEKRNMMYALSDTCKTLLAQAVIVRHVATAANMHQIGKAMGLNPPDPHNRQKVKYFEERMWKWIEKNYGRQRLSALPAEFRHDIIFVAGMGPKLEDCGTGCTYQWENGKFVTKDAPPGMECIQSMIPRWWQ